MVTSSGVPPGLASHTDAPSPCDRDCRSQQNYQAGYALGTVIGTAVGRLIHRLSVKQEGLYTISRKEEIVGETETGFALACTKKEPKKCRMVEAPLPVGAYLLMEALRNGTEDMRKITTEADRPYNFILQQDISSWIDMRNEYCRYARRALSHQ